MEFQVGNLHNLRLECPQKDSMEFQVGPGRTDEALGLPLDLREWPVSYPP